MRQKVSTILPLRVFVLFRFFCCCCFNVCVCLRVSVYVWVLAIYSWTWGQPWILMSVFCETPLRKIIFPFHASTYCRQLLGWDGNACPSLVFSTGSLSGLNRGRVCVYCHSLCQLYGYQPCCVQRTQLKSYITSDFYNLTSSTDCKM